MDIFPQNSNLENLTRVKFGIDPTFSKLHLGHFVPLRTIKKLQEQGKEITIVLGTFTAQMGDPSGKDKTRPILSEKEVKNNSEQILEQIKSVLDPGFKIFKNVDLFNSMTVPELLLTFSKFTIQNLLSRESFQKRIENNQSIGLHELIVPILQGKDSLHLKSEIEVGGSDQLFNFQITRKLQELNNQIPEVCIMTPIINGIDGKKMSKSLGNCIFLDEPTKDIFGKCMSISDKTMEEWIPLLTDLDNLPKNPMERKKTMAFDIIRQLRGKEEAIWAIKDFEKTIQNRSLPENIKKIPISDLISCIQKIKNCSKNESRRLIKSGAVSIIDSGKIDETFELKIGQILKIGKRNFGKLA